MTCGHDCDCPTYRDHLLSIGFAASAMPSRRAAVNTTTAKEKVLDRDLDAYQRLRADGVQPRSVHGNARLERHASERVEIESGRLLSEVT